MTNPGAVQIGAMIAGRYRIDRVLGQGGMGIVVQAMHLQLHQPVAIKLLLPEVLGNQQIIQRFLREAQAAVRLRSEHVARVIDVGTLETGAPYMVLEYLEGADLSTFPRSQPTIGGIVDLMLQACEALAEAHALGIVHRDIKPANFFITRGADGAPLLKVLDFGISKISTSNGPLTVTQTVMGTPAYMSPEQMRSSHDVDHRSDIWSLGVVLYELLQGAPPFGGDTFSSMVLKVVNDPLPKLTVQLPGDLDAIVYRCLEKDPARRFQSTAELAHAIAKYAQSETQAAISVQRTRSIVGMVLSRATVAAGPAQHALPSTISGSVGARTMPHRSGWRWPTVAAIGVVTGVIVIALAALSGRKAEGPSPSTQPDGTPKAASESTGSATSPAIRPSVATPPVAVPPPVVTVPPVAPPPPVVTVPPVAPPPGTPPAANAGATTASPPVATMKRPDGAATTPQTARVPPSAVSPELPAVPAPPSMATKKPRKLTKTSGPPVKPGTPPAKPRASPDDDVLGTRK